MDADERDICDFLKSFRDQYLSGKEIARRAGGKWRFREEPNWAVPVLMRLVEKGHIESDGHGHFRLIHDPTKEVKKLWISPQVEETVDADDQTADVDGQAEDSNS